MMKIWMASLALGLAMMAGSAYAGEGQMSSDALAAFGLGDMQTMSDTEGMEVRGKFAAVYGTNTASLFGSKASNSYKAVGHKEAEGWSDSTVKYTASLKIRGTTVGSVQIKAEAYGSAWAWAR